MNAKMKKYFDSKYSLLMGFLSGNKFFYIILAIVVTQALWYAFNFKPTIYDEFRHFENIEIYTEQLSPILGEQKPEWDRLGNITRSGSYMYYYLMSWPLRLLQAVSDSQGFQIIGLRFINIAMFVGAVIFMRKALIQVSGFSASIVNFSLLIFALTPAAALLAGIINYDNAAFLLFAIMLSLSVTIIKNRDKVRIDKLLYLLILGLLVSLIKYTSLALVVPLFAYLAYSLITTHGKRLPKILINDAKRIKPLHGVLIGLCLVVSLGFFLERPVTNTILYGRPSTSCENTMSLDRCRKFVDYSIYERIRENKSSEFQPVGYINYIVTMWMPTMTNTMTNTLEKGSATQLPIVIKLYAWLFPIAILLILVCLREILTDRAKILLVAVTVGYVAILISSEYSSYVKYGQLVGVRARYLVPVLPIFIALAVYSISLLLGARKYLKLVLGTIVLLSLSQGAGITTYLLTTPENIYWDRDNYSINDQAAEVIEPFIKEN